MYFFTNRGNQFGRGAVRETRASPRKDAGEEEEEEGEEEHDDGGVKGDDGMKVLREWGNQRGS